MPQRRADDAVHVVMTDHYIQRRRPDRDLLAPLQETHDDERTAYRGEVVPLYPRRASGRRRKRTVLATAQVVDDANLAAGIPRLRHAIETYRPARAEFYVELASAYSRTNQNDAAIPYYEEALRRDRARPGRAPQLRRRPHQSGTPGGRRQGRSKRPSPAMPPPSMRLAQPG